MRCYVVFCLKLSAPMTDRYTFNRLEAATSRLEDMAMSLDDPNAPKKVDSRASTGAQSSPPSQPQVAAAPLEPAAATQFPPQIDDFDALIKADVQNFVNLGAKIGGLVQEQVRE